MDEIEQKNSKPQRADRPLYVVAGLALFTGSAWIGLTIFGIIAVDGQGWTHLNPVLEKLGTTFLTSVTALGAMLGSQNPRR